MASARKQLSTELVLGVHYTQYSLGLSPAATSLLSEQGSWMLVFYPVLLRGSPPTSLWVATCLCLHIPGDGELTVPQRSHFQCGTALTLGKPPPPPSYIFKSLSYRLERPGSSLVFLRRANCGLDLGGIGGISVCSVPCEGTGSC